MGQEKRSGLMAWSYASYGVHAVKEGSGRGTAALGKYMMQAGELPVALLEMIKF